MIDFLTADPNLECLDNEPALNVYFYDNDPGLDYVIAHKSSGDCANAAFVFESPTPTTTTSSTTTTTTTPTTTTTTTAQPPRPQRCCTPTRERGRERRLGFSRRPSPGARGTSWGR